MATSDDPDAATITRHITETYPDTIVTEAMGGTFFSCNEESWPNFATIATTDAFDDASKLDRDGVFRLNAGVTGGRSIATSTQRSSPTTRRSTGSSPTPCTRGSTGSRS
jgi:uncharacterized protein DUF6194